MEPGQIESLYQRYAPVILKSLQQRGVPQEDAEDLLVDVFLAAITSTSLIQIPDEHKIAWLLRVATNKQIDYYRRKTTHTNQPLDENTLLLESPEDSPEIWAVRNETGGQLRQTIEGLSEIQQTVLRLRFDEDLPTKEIAKILHKTDNTIRVLLSRTMNVLRTLYQPHKEETNQPEHRNPSQEEA